MGKPRRSFTREFKAVAVKLVTEQGRSFAEAAANLGIAESLLRKWRNRSFPDGPLLGLAPITAVDSRPRRCHIAKVLPQKMLPPLVPSLPRPHA